MIESIEIKNLRGIRKGKLEGLTPLTILVGPNGCGKSTILDALLIVGLTESAELQSTGAGPFDLAIALVLQRHGRLKEWPRWFYWRAAEQAGCVVTGYGEGGAKRTVAIRRAGPQRQPRKVAPGGGGNPFAQVATADRAHPRLAAEVRLVEARSCVPVVPLHRLYADVANQGQQKDLFEVVRQVLPGAERVEILTEGDTPVLHVIYPDRSVPVEFAGDGVQALVRMSMQVAAPPGALVLIEEPELHLHPRAIAQSARVVVAAARTGTQIVLSTHSLELIDSILAVSDEKDIERLSVIRMKLDNGQLISHRLLGPDVAQARQVIEDDLR